MSSLRKVIAIAMLAMAWSGCSCDPIIAPPDGGSAGGSAGGSNGGGAGGGTAGGGTAGGAMGGGVGGGSGGGTAGGAGTTQFTQYVRELIVTGTSDTAQPRPASEWQALPDDAPITYPQSFFDGGP